MSRNEYAGRYQGLQAVSGRTFEADPPLEDLALVGRLRNYSEAGRST
jgi:hypothetical protein